MNKMRLFLIRHGESLGNNNLDNYRLFSNRDIPLSSEGEFQAYDLGMKLNQKLTSFKSGNNLVIATSPFFRAQQTAGLIHQQLNFFSFRNAEKDIKINPHIYEMIWSPDKSGGCWTDPSLISKYKADVQNYKFPKGECAYDVYKRAQKFLNCLVSEHSTFEEDRCNKRQSLSQMEEFPVRIIVSHELFIAHFLEILGHTNITSWSSITSLQIHNASCFEVMIDLEKRRADYVTKIF